MTRIIEKRRSIHRNANQLMEENRRLTAELASLKPLAGLGTAACMIAHELNNLLTPVGSYAELALRNTKDERIVQKALTHSHNNCRRAAEVMRGILTIANNESSEKSTNLLRELVEQVFDCLVRDFKKDNITVRTEIPDNLTVFAVPSQIQQILINLILNARDAMLSRGGTLAIAATENDNETIIIVADTGCGIAKENLKSIFQAFFSTKTSNGESHSCVRGLGLVFCKEIVQNHNGSIEVESELGKGTRFKIRLPKTEIADVT